MHAVQTIDGAEIIAFHWHPAGNSHIRDPHMHVGSTQLARDGVLSKKHHIPGSRMSVEGVLRMWATWGGDRAPEAK